MRGLSRNLQYHKDSWEVNISEDSIQPKGAFYKTDGEMRNNWLHFYLLGNHKINCFQQMCLVMVMPPALIKRQFIILSWLSNNNSPALGFSSLVLRSPCICCLVNSSFLSMRSILKDKRCFMFFHWKWNCPSFIYCWWPEDPGSVISENAAPEGKKRFTK